MKMPCDQRIDCECSPLLTNYSSEDVDRLVFLGRKFRSPGLPPIGTIPEDDCVTFTSSPTTQEDADFCAARHQSECEANANFPDPCAYCGGVRGSNNTSWASAGSWLTPLCYDSNGQVIPCPDPCCDTANLPADASALGLVMTDSGGQTTPACCCNSANGDSDEPDDPPQTPDDPADPPQIRLYGNAEQSCTANCPDGPANTFTVRAGYFIASSPGQANAMAHSYACLQAEKHKVCLGDLSGEPCLDTFFDQTISTTRGTLVHAPITFAVTAGSLPPGLDLNNPTPPDGTSARISGTPNGTGMYTFTISATAATGESRSRDYTLEVYGSTCPGDGTLCTAYVDAVSYYPPVMSGGTVSISGLPCNLSCSPSGVITGTPYEDGTFDLAITVTANGRSCTQNCTMKVIKNPSYPLDSASIGNLTWGVFHFDGGSGSGSGGPTGASVTSVTDAWFGGCQAIPSNTTVKSSILRNCTGNNINCNIHIAWNLSRTVCPADSSVVSTGQVIVTITGVIIYQNDNVGGLNPYSGSIDYPFTFGPTVGPGLLYFTAKAGAYGGGSVMNVTITISPAKPPPC
jgi:hypothetical protein